MNRKGFKARRERFCGNQTGKRFLDDYGRGVLDHPHFTNWYSNAKRVVVSK